ncbi:hypothetical protein UA08_06158 [Talaromyces atroroseus]|uniref:Uncharacterized protein n=1 Tax=Talaromyces atroroseus TaxID=1441469 RepID=A0A225AJN3_TALAT|nr:hypothetical protein UA08_06158 [Talaromyces atroroseus]OKL58484.1 hypothetical protein UA08_06158 [Talaromyces atroroseus]
MKKRSPSTNPLSPDADKIEQEEKIYERYRTEQLTPAKRLPFPELRRRTPQSTQIPTISAQVYDMNQTSSSSSFFPTTTPSQQQLLQTPPPHRLTRRAPTSQLAYSFSSPSVAAAARSRGYTGNEADQVGDEGEQDGNDEMETYQQALDKMIDNLQQDQTSSECNRHTIAFDPSFCHENNDNETITMRSQQLRPAKKLRWSTQDQDHDRPSSQ